MFQKPVHFHLVHLQIPKYSETFAMLNSKNRSNSNLKKTILFGKSLTNFGIPISSFEKGF